MTKLTRQMQRYLMSCYEDSNWLTRVLWAWKVSRMTDSEIIETYYTMTRR